MSTDNKTFAGSAVVICSYRPKPGKTEELLSVLHGHVPRLRGLGLATMHPRSLMVASDGTVIEIYEWVSEAAARAAHDHPEVKKIWAQIGELADLVPLSELKETQRPFAHFQPAANERTQRVSHFEVPADNPERVTKFYKDVFAWNVAQWGTNEYWFMDTGREPAPGIDGAVNRRSSENKAVCTIVNVPSLDAVLSKVEPSGGKIVSPRAAIPMVGWIAYYTDPDGNRGGIIEMDPTAR